MIKRKVKKGQVYWQCSAFEGKISFSEWIVRSIQKRLTYKSSIIEFYKTKAYLINKNSATWVKKSKKHFDWGWNKNISALFREDIILDEDNMPRYEYGLDGFHSTKLQALKYCLKRTTDYIVRTQRYIEEAIAGDGKCEMEVEVLEWEECLADDEKAIKTLKRMIAKEQNKRRNK